MASALFLDHERNFGVMTAEITSRIHTTIPGESGEARKSAIRHTESLILEAQELLEQMEVEFPSHSAAVKPQLRARLLNYKKEIAQLDKELRKASNQMNGEQAREELLNMDEYSTSADSKQRLLSNTERLDRTSDRLREGYKMAVETEDIGIEVLGELDRQRGVLQRTKDKLSKTDVTLKKSGLVLKTMLNRAIQNKIIMGVIILIIMGVIGGVIYWKVSHSSKSSSPPASTSTP